MDTVRMTDKDAAHLHSIRKKIILIYGIIILAGAAYTVMIHITGFGLPCLFNHFTGLLCPGCGTSRMALAAMHLDFAASFRYNPVAFVSVIVWVTVSICCFAGRPVIFRRSKTLLTILYADILCYMIFTVIRNIPGIWPMP